MLKKKKKFTFVICDRQINLDTHDRVSTLLFSGSENIN